MGYKQVKLFVKINSTFPYDKINNHFTGYLNNLQKDTEEFIIGDLFNSRENELWAIFSDKTRDSHDMPSNHILIFRNNPADKKSPSIKEEKIDLNHIRNQSIMRIINKISLQQIFNEVTGKIYKDIMKKEGQIINNITHMVSRYLITERQNKLSTNE